MSCFYTYFPPLVGYLCVITVWLCGCGGALIERPTSGVCARAPLRQWADKAAYSLTFSAFHAVHLYDQDGDGKALALPEHGCAQGCQAVLSYPDPQRFSGGDPAFSRMSGRSFTYDNALAVLWRTEQGDLAGAEAILRTLVALQRPNGAWGFSFSTGNDGFYNAGYVRTGAVAWVVYALARWQTASLDKRFAEPLARGIRWILAERNASGLYDAGYGRWRNDTQFDPDFVAQFAATEHQIDVWYALMATVQAAPQLAADLELPQRAEALAATMKRLLWMDQQHRFAQGFQGESQDSHSALDAAGTWAALWLWSQRNPELAADILRTVTSQHAVSIGDWRGLRPYLTQEPLTWFVEGSLAEPLLLSRLGRAQQAHESLQQFADLACAGQVPLVYSPVWADDFPLSPAAAPTLWFALVASELLEGKSFLWTETATSARP